MRVSPIQTNFTAGELSPRLYGRVDLARYHNGLAALENMIIMPHGGVTRRTGARYAATAKIAGRKIRLIPFEFSTSQAYVLEFGHQYIRFYMDGGQIESGGSAYEIASPYGEGDLLGLKFAQSHDTMYIAHPGYHPRKLTRSGHTSWTLSNPAFTDDPFGADGSGDCPGAVTFHEQRLVFAGTENDPQTVWGSRTGSAYYEVFTLGSNDNESWEFTLAAEKANAIQWLVSGRALIIRTSGGEWRMGSTTADTIITPTNVTVRRESTHGSSSLAGLLAGQALMFVQRHGRRVLAAAYSWEADALAARDVTLAAEHITKGGLTDWAYQQAPDSVLWCVRGDGVLLGLTYDRDNEVAGWHRHPTDGEFESVCVIPGDDRDQVWVSVKRTVGGTDLRFVEYFAGDFGDEASEAFYVDSGLTYQGAASASMSGFDHLAGRAVTVLADGAVHPDVTVAADGSIDLNWAAETIQAGLPYTSTLETLNVEAGAPDGTSQGKTKRIHSAAIRFWRTVGALFGPDEGHLDRIPFRGSANLMNSAVSPFTGDKVVDFQGDYESEGRVVIRQDQPLPMTVLAIMSQLSTHDQVRNG